MALVLKPSKLHRSIYSCITSRKYCENKSIYQIEEEGLKPRMVEGKPYPEWRKQWIQRDNEWKSKLSVFVNKNPSADYLSVVQKLPNLTVRDVKDWWQQMKIIQEIENQKFLPERLAALGSNLAAVHFFTHRNCPVRLKGETKWISGDVSTLKLPDHFVDGYFVEAVDCSNFHHNGIRYQGIENLRGLNFLKWLSLKNNKYVDVWCIDRITSQNGKSLEYLDISGCQLNIGCVLALARMSSLKVLVITDAGADMELQVALSMLEEENPKLMIKSVE